MIEFLKILTTLKYLLSMIDIISHVLVKLLIFLKIKYIQAKLCWVLISWVSQASPNVNLKYEQSSNLVQEQNLRKKSLTGTTTSPVLFVA